MTVTETVALTEQQHAWLQGVRDIAAWFESHPERIPHYGHDFGIFFFGENAKEELVAITREFGGMVPKDKVGGYFEVSKKFGPHKISGNISEDQFCEKVVTTVTEEVTEPDPELLAQVPTVTRTVEVEKVEWVCPPSLLAAS